MPLKNHDFCLQSNIWKHEKINSEIAVCKVNVDSESSLASEFAVVSIPTVLIVKNGKVLNAYVPEIFGKEKRKSSPSKEGKLGVEGMERELLYNLFLPYTDDLPESFYAAYGEDLLAGLPELIWDLPEGKTSVPRYRYHDHISERFASAFADKIGIKIPTKPDKIKNTIITDSNFLCFE